MRVLLPFLALLLLTASGVRGQGPGLLLQIPEDREMVSETGRFSVFVPEGWVVGTRGGIRHRGEFVFWHAGESTYFSPAAVTEDVAEVEGISPEAAAEWLLGELVASMQVEADVSCTFHIEILPRETRTVGGLRFISQVVTSPGADDFTFGVIDAPEGLIYTFATSPPGTEPAWLDAMLGNLRVHPISE